MSAIKELDTMLLALPVEKQQAFADLIDPETATNAAKMSPALGNYLAQFAEKDYKVPGYEAPAPKKRGLMSRLD